MRLARPGKERRNAYPVRIVVVVRPERTIRREEDGGVEADEDVEEGGEAYGERGEEEEQRTRGERGVVDGIIFNGRGVWLGFGRSWRVGWVWGGIVDHVGTGWRGVHRGVWILNGVKQVRVANRVHVNVRRPSYLINVLPPSVATNTII